MAYNVKSIREKFKENGIFYTPPELAEYMKNLLPNDITEVYDPTCGHGDLLKIFSDDIKKYGQDINQDAIEEANNIPNSEMVCADTLKEPAFLGKKFKAIIANYPYSIKWDGESLKDDERFKIAPVLPPNSKADYAFILHILHYLSNDGVAAVMSFPGIAYRGQREGKIRQWLIEQNYIDTVIHIGPGKFIDTGIATLILVLKKNRKTTDITFINEEDGVKKVVPLSEIVGNDYNISVSAYAFREVVKEKIDPVQLENDVRDATFRHFEKSLEVTYQMWLHFREVPLYDWLDKFEKLIQKYKRLVKQNDKTNYLQQVLFK